MDSISKISDSELELMRIIWSFGGTALFAQIMNALEDQGSKQKANTVLTLLSRLIEKGMLSVKKQGRRNEYIALASKDAYAESQTAVFIDKVYEGSAKGLITALLRQNHLTKDDMAELKAFWEEEAEK